MPGEFVSMDMTGPFTVKSIHGNRYGLIFIDQHSIHICHEDKGQVSKFSKTVLDKFQGSAQTMQGVWNFRSQIVQ